MLGPYLIEFSRVENRRVTLGVTNTASYPKGLRLRVSCSLVWLWSSATLPAGQSISQRGIATMTELLELHQRYGC